MGTAEASPTVTITAPNATSDAVPVEATQGPPPTIAPLPTSTAEGGATSQVVGIITADGVKHRDPCATA